MVTTPKASGKDTGSVAVAVVVVVVVVVSCSCSCSCSCCSCSFSLEHSPLRLSGSADIEIWFLFELKLGYFNFSLEKRAKL